MLDAMLAVARVIEYYGILVFLCLFFVALFTVRKRSALLLALLLAAVSGPLLKEYYGQERPCLGQNAKIICPPTAGLPSLHAMGATVFAVGALGTPAFLFFAPVAALIGYSRVFLNVHSVEQVAAGVALGITLYSFAVGLRARLRREKPFAVKQLSGKQWRRSHEFQRQVLHVVFGAAIIGLAVLAGVSLAVTLLLLALSAGIFAVGLVMLGVEVPLANEILDAFERKRVVPGKGAMHYAAGALLLLTFAQTSFALAMIAVLAFGDGASTIAGKLWGKAKLPWNSSKSWVGTAAFFLAGLASAAFFTPIETALSYSLLLALIESLPTHVDDNLLIPVSALALQAVQKAVGL